MLCGPHFSCNIPSTLKLSSRSNHLTLTTPMVGHLAKQLIVAPPPVIFIPVGGSYWEPVEGNWRAP